MASRRISSLLSRSLSPYLTSSAGRSSCIRRGLQKYSTAAAIDEPITPPVDINYTKLLINGKFVDAASGKTFHTVDPRTGKVIVDVAEGDAEDVNRAVSAARKAFDEGPWPKMTAYERSKILLKFADLIEKHNDAIAALETWDNGKPYEQAANIEIPMVARLFRYYAGWADKIHGLTVPADGPYHVQTLHEPIGVAGQIIPWNFPLLMFSWKVGPALACGNIVVIKTAEQTPLSALYVANLFHEVWLCYYIAIDHCSPVQNVSVPASNVPCMKFLEKGQSEDKGQQEKGSDDNELLRSYLMIRSSRRSYLMTRRSTGEVI